MRAAADEFLNLLWLWAWWRFLFSILRTVTTNIMDFNFQSWRPMPPPPSSFSKKEMLMKHSTSIIIPSNCHVCTATLNIIFIFFFSQKKISWNLKDLDDCYHNWGTLCKKKNTQMLMRLKICIWDDDVCHWNSLGSPMSQLLHTYFIGSVTSRFFIAVKYQDICGRL